MWLSLPSFFFFRLATKLRLCSVSWCGDKTSYTVLRLKGKEKKEVYVSLKWRTAARFYAVFKGNRSSLLLLLFFLSSHLYVFSLPLLSRLLLSSRLIRFGIWPVINFGEKKTYTQTRASALEQSRVVSFSFVFLEQPFFFFQNSFLVFFFVCCFSLSLFFFSRHTQRVKWI